MNKTEMYAIAYPTDEMASKQKLEFFATQDELAEKLIELQKQVTDLGQNFLTFTKVYPLNAAHNTETYDAFHLSVKEKRGMHKHFVGGYLVERTLKNGKKLLKTYNFIEDFDYQIKTWREKGDQEIVVLNENHSSTGSYYYFREIKQQWGQHKQALFV